MKTVILDSHAVLLFFEREPGWEQVADLFTKSAEGTTRLLLSVVNWGEIVYITRRVYGAEKSDEVIQAIDELPVDVIDVDRKRATRAAALKARGGIAYTDCFAAELALDAKGVVATGDPEFTTVESVVDVLWIPGPAQTDEAAGR